MQEILQDNFEFRMRIDAIQAEPKAFKAIAETWEFMTGSAIPDDIVDQASNTVARQNDSINPWALKLAYEATALTRLSAFGRAINNDKWSLKGDPRVLMDYIDQLEFPDSDPMMTELIRRLGEEILDTAYLALGPDVDKEIEDFLSQQSEDMPVLDQIDLMLTKFDSLFRDRLSVEPDIAEPKGLFKDQNGKTINHILRLSPHYLRSIEPKTLLPTCLSMSIIMASFLRKCGVSSIFHVGVVTPIDWAYAGITQSIGQSIDDFASSHTVPYPQNVREMIRRRTRSAKKTANDWDPHSALVFSIGELHVLCDPYQNSSVYLDTKRSKKQFGEIADLQVVQPGLEVLYTPDEDLSHREWAEGVWETYLTMLEIPLPSPRRWETALYYATQDGSPQPILDVLDTLKPNDAKTYADFIMSSGMFNCRIRSKDFIEEEEIEKHIQNIRSFACDEAEKFIRESLAMQVFWLKKYDEDKFLECLIRCNDDEEYFKRRLEDLALWPYRMMLIGVQRAWQDATGNESELTHLALEVGHIEHRIGACSLLDVSYGLKEDLPLSFWARQTSSQLPWLYSEQAGRYDSESSTGQEVSDKLKRVLQVLSWRYRQIIGII